MLSPVVPRSLLLQVGFEAPGGWEVQYGIDPALALVGSAVGSFLTALIVGAIMIALAPEYTRRRMATVHDDPVGCFVYGFLSIVLLVLAIVVLFFTIIGIVVVIPLVLLAFLAWAVGAAIVYLTIGDQLVGHDDGWTKPLALGAAIAGGLSLIPLGGVVAFGVGTAGFSAVLKDHSGDDDADERTGAPDEDRRSGGRSGDPVADELDR